MSILDILAYLIVLISIIWSLWKAFRFFKGSSNGCPACGNGACSLKERLKEDRIKW